MIQRDTIIMVIGSTNYFLLKKYGKDFGAFGTKLIWKHHFMNII
jgi:hypothetical protein